VLNQPNECRIFLSCRPDGCIIRLSACEAFWENSGARFNKRRLQARAKAAVNRSDVMPDHIYKVVELVGSSDKSIEDAIASAITRAHATIRNLRWFEVTQTRGNVENGKVAHYQVSLKVGFTME
jgi:dodecin